MAVAHAQDTAGSSKAGLRKFGLTVGGAFALFGLVSYARGHTVAPRVLWTIAALLITPAVVAPAVLGPVQRVWMRGAMALGHVNSRVILTIFFYLVMTPIGVVMRLFRDPLARSLEPDAASHWIKRVPGPSCPPRPHQQLS